MRKTVLLALLLATTLLASAQQSGVEPAARQVIEQHLAALARVEDMTYLIEKTERMRDGELVKETLKVKLRVAPYAVYLARTKPSEGMEAIYRAGKNDGEMTGHKGSFPDVTLDLDPEGGTAMEDQHHPIHSTGLAEVTRRIKLALGLALAGQVQIRRRPDHEVGGRPAVCIEVDASRTGGRKVRAREDETLHDLARRVGSWPYLLYQHNPHIDDLDDELDAGQQVFVPTYYAKRAEFCFDRETHLLIREEYHDAKGRLYERYDILQRRTNVGLAERDFDPDNEDYDF